MASLRPELITEIGGFPVTNTLIATLLVDVVIVALVFVVYKRIRIVPTGLQSIFEPAIDYLYDLTESIAGTKAKTIFPWFASFFFFILIANFIALLPGFGTIGIWEKGPAHESTAQHSTEKATTTAPAATENGNETPSTAHEIDLHETAPHEATSSNNHATTTSASDTAHEEPAHATTESSKHLLPILRGATSDFNLTLALATISVVMTHIIAFRYNGLVGYAKKFLSKNPINLAIGLLEFLLEGVKIFSLSFRLFGNIFAGEVVLVTVAGLAAYSAFLAPIPFLLLEVIVALVQALVFAMLTMVFMSLLATTSSEGGGH